MFRNQLNLLYASHRADLVRYANGIVGSRPDAEDVVQEAYLKLDEAAKSRPLEEPIAYLFRIVRNLSIDAIRRQVRQRDVFVEGVDGEAVPDGRATPERFAMHRRELGVVLSALDELPERTRMAVRLHRIEGCRLAEIADRLGISTALAHALVCDGLAHCRERLRKA